MGSGAFALHIDPQAGGGNNPPIDRIVPLPHRGHDDGDGIQFDDRRLTLSYAQPAPIAGTNYLAALTVTGRFLGSAAAIKVTIRDGECRALDVPREACAAYLHVDRAVTDLRGPLSALVEYSD